MKGRDAMSTRSATIIMDNDWNGGKVEVVRFYRHCDGYPEGHGADIAKAIKNSTLEGACSCQGILANLLNMNCRIEFEPFGTEHSDIEFLYVVDAADKTIALYSCEWDESYTQTLARKPLFVGDADAYLDRFPCCYTQTDIRTHTTYHVSWNGGDEREHFSDLDKARQFRDEAPDAGKVITWDEVKSFINFGRTFV